MKSSRPLITLAIVAILLAVLIFLVVRASKKRSAVAVLPDGSQIEMVDAGLANVSQVNVELLESFPLQARAVANGSVSGCDTVLAEPVTSYNDLDKSFNITLGMQQPAGHEMESDCQDKPFTELIPLEITGFAAGEYTVAVNGVAASFMLDIDNEIDFELDKG